MSLGYGGFARLVLKDEKSALYVYKCENLNRLDNDPKEDGQIYIELEPIASAHVPKKTKRYPEGIPLLFVENVDFGKCSPTDRWAWRTAQTARLRAMME